MEWLDVIIKAIPDFFEAVADVIIKATPDFLGAWADVLVKATPSFGQVALPAMAIISCFFLLFMMEADA